MTDIRLPLNTTSAARWGCLNWKIDTIKNYTSIIPCQTRTEYNISRILKKCPNRWFSLSWLLSSAIAAVATMFSQKKKKNEPMVVDTCWPTMIHHHCCIVSLEGATDVWYTVEGTTMQCIRLVLSSCLFSEGNFVFCEAILLWMK